MIPPDLRAVKPGPVRLGNPGVPNVPITTTEDTSKPRATGPTTPAPLPPASAPRLGFRRGPITTGPTPPGPTTPRGMPMVFTRGRSAADRLRIDWDSPVYVPHKAQQTGAVLTRDRAFAFLRGEDRRPLLVLRECHLCAGTDFALLRRATKNERTMLLTRWFHCVKLPATVTRKDHALHQLFPGKDPPHVFFATPDGTNVVTLPGDQAPSAVWKGMLKILRQSYRGNPGTAIKRLLETLDEFDNLDAKELEVRRRLDRTLETDGPKSPRFRTLKKQFAALQSKRTALLARERKLLDLGLRK